MKTTLTDRENKALRLVNCGTRLTEFGNVLVSRAATQLLQAGLIRQAPQKWIAYELTTSGSAALNANCSR